MTAPQLHLPRTVASDQTERAVDLLQLYFKSRKFIGSQWDGFDPSGTRAASANVFTSDDVASADNVVAMFWGAEDLTAGLGGTASRDAS